MNTGESSREGRGGGVALGVLRENLRKLYCLWQGTPKKEIIHDPPIAGQTGPKRRLRGPMSTPGRPKLVLCESIRTRTHTK